MSTKGPTKIDSKGYNRPTRYSAIKAIGTSMMRALVFRPTMNMIHQKIIRHIPTIMERHMEKLRMTSHTRNRK